MNPVNGRAYSYEFKLLLEGIEVPFKSANVICTPNGVEFNINVHVNEELFNLKPKTAAQIFFREWYGTLRAWRIMADGFFSGFVTGEDSTGGRAIGITCRDFRMDIRKSPAAIAWMGNQEIGIRSLYSINGIYQKSVTKSLTGKVEEDIETYDSTGLKDLASSIARMAGTAYGKAGTPNGGHYFDSFDFTTSEVESATKKGDKVANGGLFLDAFVRGMWIKAVGGTRVNSFLNSRLRCDKRFLIPRNYAGFNFWKRANFGLEVGTTIMGNSKFSSLEAAIMNTAGMFSCRVYSCSTPSIISIDSKDNPLGADYIMDRQVRNFMMGENKEDFGSPWILNESMLLPPMEFTAPPNCNLFFPPMYDRVNWQRDEDADITRGYFDVIHSLNTPTGVDFGAIKFQIPNDMFNVKSYNVDVKKRRLPLTLEERYKGVNVYHGSVEYNLAAADAAKSLGYAAANKKGEKKAEAAEAKANDAKDAVSKTENQSTGPESGGLGVPYSPAYLAEQKAKEQKAKTNKAKAVAQAKMKRVFGGSVATAYKRHAMIKWVNMKYLGRVVQIDMNFNPFVMCGFPGAVISARDELGTNVSKTMIGMVQQVSHNIFITQNGADASTTVIMNNVRFEDEPTDLDSEGLPLYIQATDKNAAEVDIKTLDFVKPDYRVPDASAPVSVDNDESSKYDLKETDSSGKGYRFVKDFLSTSKGDLSEGKSERTYLDESYEPNRIFKFYKTVFRHNAHHFMIGRNGSKYFAYNSMHEAFTDLRETRPDLLVDYDACISFVKRNICSADAFYHGILGLSSRETLPSGSAAYIHRDSDFLDAVIEKVYFGISSDDYDAGKASGLNMLPGGFSSIREYNPITAFIEERRDAVKEYKKKAMQSATGVKFNG